MRGLKTVGQLFILAAVLGFTVPTPVRAQSATADQYFAAGNQYFNAKSYAQAARYYYAAVKLNPNDGPAYQGLGNCYYSLGRKADALAFYQRASALQPSNAALAQFVRGLQAQVASGTSTTSTGASGASNYLAAGYSLFQHKQYAQALQYFNAAIRQNPNDYRPYYYAGYSYYMTGNAKYAALYFAVANAKQPNASIQAYADRVKASLAPADQQWVDDQVAKYSGGATAVAQAGGKGVGPSFGFHLMGGSEYVFADPTDIKQYVAGNGGVSLTGVTPNVVALPELEPFLQVSKSFEINLAIGYFPVGNMSYTTYDYNQGDADGSGVPDVHKYSFDTTIITADLGVKLLFGDKDVRGYLGLSGGISPVSLTFNKVPYDHTGSIATGMADPSSGDYTTMAVNGQALLGVDFSLGKGIAVGPYVGYRYLSATNFQSGGNTLAIDTQNGAVGRPGDSNFPLNDPSKALTLDFSGLEGGINLSFSF
jgi:tetratricopeptide (TPR) repeat protein